MTGLEAWNACATIVQADYILFDHPGATIYPLTEEYRPNNITELDDGTFDVSVAVIPAPDAEDAPSIVARCTIGGTLADPVLSDYSLVDV